MSSHHVSPLSRIFPNLGFHNRSIPELHAALLRKDRATCLPLPPAVAQTSLDGLHHPSKPVRCPQVAFVENVINPIETETHEIRVNLVLLELPFDNPACQSPGTLALTLSCEAEPSDADVQRLFENEIRSEVKRVKTDFDPRVFHAFKDVTYETFHDKGFRKLLENRFGTDAIARLFSEHDTSGHLVPVIENGNHVTGYEYRVDSWWGLAHANYPASIGKPSAEFGREFSDGTLIVAEVEVSEQGAVSIKSAWKKRPGRNHEGATSYPVHTSENTAGLPTNLHSDSLIVNPESVSKVVDANGEPLVVWHGTNADFDKFDPNLVGKVFGYDTKGFFFSSLESDAMDYAKNAARRNGGTLPTRPSGR